MVKLAESSILLSRGLRQKTKCEMVETDLLCSIIQDQGAELDIVDLIDLRHFHLRQP